MAQFGGRAVKHNLPAYFAGAGAHVDHAVGGHHHGRVVLNHHQRVTGVAQPVHGLGDAVHVARMQADGRLVKHKQSVHQRGAQRRGQVDALHLATRERAALPVQREVADADIAQVLEPGVDFFKQQLERFAVGFVGQSGRPDPREKISQLVNGQLHQIMQGQPRHGFELRACPLHAHRHEAPGRRQHRVGSLFGAQTPEQCVGLQACAAAAFAGGVTAVLGQQHTDVHLVRLALQVLKKSLDAEPVLVPLAVPAGRAVDDPGLVLRREFVPGRVTRYARRLGVAHQVVLRLGPGRRLHDLDGTRAQRQFVVGNHQAVIDSDDSTKATASLAGAHGRVKGEQRRRRLGVTQVTFRTMHAAGKTQHLVGLAIRLKVHIESPAPLEGRLDGLNDPGLFCALHAKAVSHHVE